MKIGVINALAIVILLSAITANVMASQGSWDAIPAYNIFLDGTYPSLVDRSYKLVNQNPC
jgi:hypothetical protein